LFFFFSFESILRKKLEEEFGDVESIFCDVVDDINVLLIMMMMMLLMIILFFLFLMLFFFS
jgi:hypothetical protein